MRNRAADVFATFYVCFFLLCAWLLNSVRGISWAAVARCGHTALSGRPSAGLIGLALYLFSSSCMHTLQTQTCSAASFTIYTGKLISKSRLVCERVIQPPCSFRRSASVVGIMRKSALTFNGFFSLTLLCLFLFVPPRIISLTPSGVFNISILTSSSISESNLTSCGKLAICS